ncbi:MAG: NUDIX domain-containing protein [Anaerolineae bacterium]
MTHHLPIREYASAGGVVIADSGEHVLVLRRPKRLGPDGRVEVRLPKGHIESHESPQQTALREVREEAGLSCLGFLGDLGEQLVEFDWKGQHYIRRERCFLLTTLPNTELSKPEEQFERLWLPWDDALAQLSFEAEREWVRRAQWVRDARLEDIPQQDPEEADNHAQMKK